MPKRPIDQAVVEAAAKALEKNKMQSAYEWTDEQFEVWWNLDDRCRREEKIAEARILLETARDILMPD